MNIKSLISTAAIVAGMSVAAPAANAFDYNDIDWTVTADVVSEYVFRGTTLGSESTQLGLQADYNNFYVGTWTSNAFGEESLLSTDELDIYAGYGFDLPYGFTGDVGGTIYHYPQLGDLFDFGDDLGSPISLPVTNDDASTFELFAGATYDHALSPTVYAYYDTLLQSFTLEGTTAYTYPLTPSFNLDLNGTLGYVSLDNATNFSGGDNFTSYIYGALGGNVSYPFAESTSAYIGINGGFSSEDTFVDSGDSFEDFEANGSFTTDSSDTVTFWVGTGISHSF